MINITPKASTKIKYLKEQDNIPHYGLKIGVRGGGCSGLSYLIEFAEDPEEDDLIWDIEGLKIFVDPKSHIYLSGTTLDYVESLMETGFKFLNPNATKSCGCGESFSV